MIHHIYQAYIFAIIFFVVKGKKYEQRQRSLDVGSVTIYIWQYTEESCKLVIKLSQYTCLNSAVDRGFQPVKLKTIKLVLIASPLSMQL